jgi:hypothetical protein
MSKKRDTIPAETAEAPERPVCPYCKTPCKSNGTKFGIRYFICNVEIGGCGNFTTKRGKPSAPAYDNQGFSARP